MFEGLTGRLSQVLERLRGQGRLSEENIQDSLREVRMALLEADVALPVVRDFIERVRLRAVGQEVLQSLTPGQALIKVVRDELVVVLGVANAELALNTTPPAVILLAGLQGSGKTTTAAKLARWLKHERRKNVLMASCDVYRPAAIDQLKTLASEIGVAFFPSNPSQGAAFIAAAALDEARRRHHDVLIVDTAGRLHVDSEMMAEVRALHALLHPIETLFVVDSMTGQDAATTARAFDEALPLTGVILTKTDGDARGGAALSIRHITGKPIKFLGVGERSGALEPFHPDRLASRILGMGDVLSLVEQAERSLDRDKAVQLADKLKKGKDFDLEDLREQLVQMLSMGGLGALLDKLPGMTQLPKAVKEQVNDKDIRRQIAIINSMTARERRFPDLLNGSRKRRVAAGSGTQVQDINRLVKQYAEMRKVMKKMKGGGLTRMLRGLKGRLPHGAPF